MTSSTADQVATTSDDTYLDALAVEPTLPEDPYAAKPFNECFTLETPPNTTGLSYGLSVTGGSPTYLVLGTTDETNPTSSLKAWKVSDFERSRLLPLLRRIDAAVATAATNTAMEEAITGLIEAEGDKGTDAAPVTTFFASSDAPHQLFLNGTAVEAGDDAVKKAEQVSLDTRMAERVDTRYRHALQAVAGCYLTAIVMARAAAVKGEPVPEYTKAVRGIVQETQDTHDAEAALVYHLEHLHELTEALEPAPWGVLPDLEEAIEQNTRQESDGGHWTREQYENTWVSGTQVDKLMDSAVAPLVAAARGYSTIEPRAINLQGREQATDLRHYQGYNPHAIPDEGPQRQRLQACLEKGGDILVMPWTDPEEAATGAAASVNQYRPSKPAIDGNGRPQKYEFPARRRVPIGVHPAFPGSYKKGATTVIIAEGLLKGDSALSAMLTERLGDATRLNWDGGTREEAIERLRGLLEEATGDPETGEYAPVLILTIGGSGNWHDSPDWDTYRLGGRRVLIGFDGDVATNPDVYAQAKKLWALLSTTKKVKSLGLLSPTVKGNPTAGIDDYLAYHGEWSDLLEQVQYKLPKAPLNPKILDLAAEKAAEAAKTGLTIEGLDEDDQRTESEKRAAAFATIDPVVCKRIAAKGVESFAYDAGGFGDRCVEHLRRRLAYVPELDVMRVYFNGVWTDDPKLVLTKLAVATVAKSIGRQEAMLAEQHNETVIKARAELERAKEHGFNTKQLESDLAEAVKGARRDIDAFYKDCDRTATFTTKAIDAIKARLSVPSSAWNPHTLLVNTPTGTFHAGKGIHREHRATDYITMQTAVTPVFGEPATPDVQSVLDHLEAQGEGTAEMMLRSAGLAFLAVADAKTAWTIVGASNSGKSTFMFALIAAGGGANAVTRYGVVVNASTFDKKQGRASGHTDTVDAMAEKRFVVIDEAGSLYLDSELFKDIAGGGVVSSSAKSKSTRSWESRLKLFFMGEEQFKFPSGDGGLVNRLLPVHFTTLPAKMDEAMSVRLKKPENLASLLGLALEAAHRWYLEYKEGQSEGIARPARAALRPAGDVTEMLAGMVAVANPLTSFFEAYCVLGDEEELAKEYGNDGRVTSVHLHRLYNDRAQSLGRQSMSKALFDKACGAASLGTTTPTEFWAESKRNGRKQIKGRMRTGVRVADLDTWTELVNPAFAPRIR